MPITALPTPPSRSDSANFATRADAFLGALPTFATEANTLQTARDRLILRIDGEKRGDDQGIICGECCYKIKLEEYDCDYGTVIDDW